MESLVLGEFAHLPNAQTGNLLYFPDATKSVEKHRRPVFTAMGRQRARSRSFGAKFVYVSRWLHIAVKTGCPQRPAVTAMWIQWIYIAVKLGLWGLPVFTAIWKLFVLDHKFHNF